MEKFVIVDKCNKVYCAKTGQFYFGNEDDANVLFLDRVAAKNYLSTMAKSLSMIAQPRIVPVTCAINYNMKDSPAATKEPSDEFTDTELEAAKSLSWACIDDIHNKKMISDDVHTILLELISICELYSQRYKEAQAEQSRGDLELQDLYHYIELSTLDAVGMSKAAKLLRDRLIARRIAKNDIQFLNKLFKLIINWDGDDPTNIFNTIKAQCLRLTNASYIDRTTILEKLK